MLLFCFTVLDEVWFLFWCCFHASFVTFILPYVFQKLHVSLSSLSVRATSAVLFWCCFHVCFLTCMLAFCFSVSDEVWIFCYLIVFLCSWWFCCFVLFLLSTRGMFLFLGLVFLFGLCFLKKLNFFLARLSTKNQLPGNFMSLPLVLCIFARHFCFFLMACLCLFVVAVRQRHHIRTSGAAHCWFFG